MANIKGRLVMSNIANLITLPLFLSAIIVEIIDIYPLYLEKIYIRIFGEYSDISHMMEAYYLLLLV